MKQTVFIDLGEGYLEPRSVTTGDRTVDRVVITGGLSGGERVVASATVLIDSESQLKAAASGMGRPSGHEPHAPAGAPPKVQPRTPSGGEQRHD